MYQVIPLNEMSSQLHHVKQLVMGCASLASTAMHASILWSMAREALVLPVIHLPLARVDFCFSI
jgi:hypothetical protein